MTSDIDKCLYSILITRSLQGGGTYWPRLNSLLWLGDCKVRLARILPRKSLIRQTPVVLSASLAGNCITKTITLFFCLGIICKRDNLCQFPTAAATSIHYSWAHILCYPCLKKKEEKETCNSKHQGNDSQTEAGTDTKVNSKQTLVRNCSTCLILCI